MNFSRIEFVEQTIQQGRRGAIRFFAKNAEGHPACAERRSAKSSTEALGNGSEIGYRI